MIPVRLLSASALVVMGAVFWSATARGADKVADKSREVIGSVYNLQNHDARLVAKSLAELLRGREDVRIEADQSRNRLVIIGAKEDREALVAFLKVVDRSSKGDRSKPAFKFMFPEGVERAMIGEGRMREWLLPRQTNTWEVIPGPSPPLEEWRAIPPRRQKMEP